jgi:hypothetical protein
MSIPCEFSIGGVYVPPLLVAGLLAVFAAVLTSQLLNRVRLSRYFFYPPLVFVALVFIYSVILGTVLIPI